MAEKYTTFIIVCKLKANKQWILTTLAANQVSDVKFHPGSDNKNILSLIPVHIQPFMFLHTIKEPLIIVIGTAHATTLTVTGSTKPKHPLFTNKFQLPTYPAICQSGLEEILAINKIISPHPEEKRMAFL